MTDEQFQDTVWAYYADHGRSMPWRDDPSPYRVLVSELMLQQTQVPRVLPKFGQFMAVFPDVDSLAAASLADVLTVWQGLGYNRRAKFLHEAAKKIVDDYDGVFPDGADALVGLPGIGKNTAGAIIAYAFDRPSAFVETNIRTVMFHHFFTGRTDVSDREVLARVIQTLPNEHMREWYWALMDYGSHLKRESGGLLDVSRHHKKQAPLRGSVREVRGQIVKALATGGAHEAELRRSLLADDRFESALSGLILDGLVTRDDDRLRLTA